MAKGIKQQIEEADYTDSAHFNKEWFDKVLNTITVSSDEDLGIYTSKEGVRKIYNHLFEIEDYTSKQKEQINKAINSLQDGVYYITKDNIKKIIDE